MMAISSWAILSDVHVCDVQDVYGDIMFLSQRTHDVMITSLVRQNDVATSFRRNDDVIST